MIMLAYRGHFSSLSMVTTLLAGDIGGTKTSLRLVQTEPGQLQQTPLYDATFASQQFPDLVPLVQDFLQGAIATRGTCPPIDAACFGIAGPVVNNTSELTNLHWQLSAERLATELTIPQVCLINDFSAIAYGLAGLIKEDLLTLQAAPAQPDAPIAVLGAGTGLGQGFLIPTGKDSYQVFASEGAHADFPARTALEIELLQDIRQRYHLERVSIERIVSGLGILSIYQFLREKYPQQESPSLRDSYRQWQENSEETDLAAAIAHHALNSEDPLAFQTMDLFLDAYGAEAGNLGLKLLPYGGLYIAGGIAAKILPLLQKSSFMQAFRQKGRMSPIMTQIPVQVVLNPQVGLIGAGIRAAQIT